MSNKKPKFKFGDRVGYEGVDFKIIFFSSDKGKYRITDGFDYYKSGEEWAEEKDLTLLPKTRNEILKDMIDGAVYVRKMSFFKDIKYFFNGGYFINEVAGYNCKEVTNMGDFDNIQEFTRLEESTPETKPLKDWGILETEITEEQAKKIKEVIEGVK